MSVACNTNNVIGTWVGSIDHITKNRTHWWVLITLLITERIGGYWSYYQNGTHWKEGMNSIHGAAMHNASSLMVQSEMFTRVL